ncbi:MAG: DUF4231 domain-containing protein [Terracidiphilus sp.]
MALHPSSSPPRPRQVVQIGVTGHRPNRISPESAAALPGQCEQVLKAVAHLASSAHDCYIYAPAPPLLRILSPLAEGADRIVARAGLALGADLQCPLPFHADEYCRDFEDAASRDEFHALLAKASAVFQIEGSRAGEDAAYERAGRIVLEQSDLLIAIWDGEPAAGRGGTTQIVEEALAQHIPVVWLNASEPKDPCILLADAAGRRIEKPLAELKLVFAGRFSGSDDREKGFNFSHAYFAEKQPTFDPGRIFRIFRDLVARGRLRRGSWRVASFEKSSRDEWERMLANSSGLPDDTRSYLLDRLCPHYAWADGLSAYYAGALRSSALATSLMAAFAVMVPMVDYVCSRHKIELGRFPALTEFSLIVVILAITWYGRRRRWHERWLNLRQLAELLRQYCYLAPLGCALASPPPPAHFRSGFDRSWVDGMFRNIARDLGLVNAQVNHAYVSSVAELIADILEGQVKYHERNHETMHELSHHLHLIGTALFIGTLLACVWHVIFGESSWLLLLATVPPAFGAAFYGIANHGEFVRSGDRSLAMARELEAIQSAELHKALASPHESFAALRQTAEKVASVMIAETMDWSFVFRYRTLNLPG